MPNPIQLSLCLLAGTLAGCLSAGQGGSVAAVDVQDGVGDLDAPADTVIGDTSVHDVAVTDTADTTVADTTVADTLFGDSADGDADTHVADTGQHGCGDGVLDPDELCDDGNSCDLDGCIAPTCAMVPTVVLYRLSLDTTVAFDLDDADEDHDLATGGDNRLGSNGLIAPFVNPLIEQAISQGSFVQLVTLNGLDSLVDDPSVSLAFHPGVDPACPSTVPVPWSSSSMLIPHIHTDARAWAGCQPPTTLAAAVLPIQPAPVGPDPPVLTATSATPLTLPAGPLGELTVARSHLEAQLVGGDNFVDLLHGRLGGVVPASALYRIDTSSFLPGCPTALHAVLALVGHIDQDAEDNGGKDWIQFALGGPQPCIADPVTIVGCCNDGDCTDFVPGAACALDPRIGDGYSAGFRFEARAVRIDGQVDGAAWCSP